MLYDLKKKTWVLLKKEMLNDPYHANIPFIINTRRANRTNNPITV